LNLETTITDSIPKINKTYTFKADKNHLEWLKKFNKNLYVNLANNHIWDYKEQWMLDTMNNLDDYDIWYFWLWKNIEEANKMKIVEIKWNKIWLIWQNCISPVSYKAWINKIWSAFFDKERLKSEIEKARENKVDIIILNAHCWIEYTNWPNKTQKDYYHFAIDNWVDLVIWHHPHWYQWIEKYKWKIIFYSLWDYIFDIFRWRRTQEWIIADIEIKDKKIHKINIEAVHIYGFWNTKLATKKQKKVILDELQQISNKLWDIKTIKNWYIKLEG
jgi:poly-gamma-glutamate synthesis protein (capsule biosynthesis protein)